MLFSEISDFQKKKIKGFIESVKGVEVGQT